MKIDVTRVQMSHARSANTCVRRVVESQMSCMMCWTLNGLGRKHQERTNPRRLEDRPELVSGFLGIDLESRLHKRISFHIHLPIVYCLRMMIKSSLPVELASHLLPCV